MNVLRTYAAAPTTSKPYRAEWWSARLWAWMPATNRASLREADRDARRLARAGTPSRVVQL